MTKPHIRKSLEILVVTCLCASGVTSPLPLVPPTFSKQTSVQHRYPIYCVNTTETISSGSSEKYNNKTHVATGADETIFIQYFSHQNQSKEKVQGIFIRQNDGPDVGGESIRKAVKISSRVQSRIKVFLRKASSLEICGYGPYKNVVILESNGVFPSSESGGNLRNSGSAETLDSETSDDLNQGTKAPTTEALTGAKPPGTQTISITNSNEGSDFTFETLAVSTVAPQKDLPSSQIVVPNPGHADGSSSHEDFHTTSAPENQDSTSVEYHDDQIDGNSLPSGDPHLTDSQNNGASDEATHHGEERASEEAQTGEVPEELNTISEGKDKPDRAKASQDHNNGIGPSDDNPEFASPEKSNNKDEHERAAHDPADLSNDDKKAEDRIHDDTASDMPTVEIVFNPRNESSDNNNATNVESASPTPVADQQQITGSLRNRRLPWTITGLVVCFLAGAIFVAVYTFAKPVSTSGSPSNVDQADATIDRDGTRPLAQVSYTAENAPVDLSSVQVIES